MQGDTYPDKVDVASDGVKFIKRTAVDIGQTLTPSSVAVDGDGLKITLPLVAWTKAAGTRPVVAWLITPETGSSEAIYTGVAELDGSDVVVNVPHVFGQGSPSTVAADYAVFVAGPVLQATAIDPDHAAKVGQVSAGSIGFTGQNVVRSLDQVEESLDLLWEGPTYVGAGVGEFDTIAEALAAGHRNLMLCGGGTIETSTVTIPRDCTIRSMYAPGQIAGSTPYIDWSFDEPLFLLTDPVNVHLQGLTFYPQHTGAVPADQDRVIIRIAPTDVDQFNNVVIEDIATAMPAANNCVSGVIDASGLQSAESLVIRNVDAWFTDYGIDLGGATNVAMENVTVRRNYSAAQVGTKKFGVRINGGAIPAGHDWDGRVQMRNVIVRGTPSGGANPFHGPGIQIGDTAAVVGARLHGCMATYTDTHPALDLGSNCDDVVVSDSEFVTASAATAVSIEGTRCAVHNVKAWTESAVASCVGINVNGPRTRVTDCDVKAAGIAGSVGINITATTASDFSIITGCQTNGTGLTNGNAANTTVANNRDDA